MKDILESLSIAAQISAYILGIIAAIQIIKIILGGSWVIEDVILALVILTVTICFGIMGYFININNRISKVEKIVHGHIQWHRGKEFREIGLTRKT